MMTNTMFSSNVCILDKGQMIINISMGLLYLCTLFIRMSQMQGLIARLHGMLKPIFYNIMDLLSAEFSQTVVKIKFRCTF